MTGEKSPVEADSRPCGPRCRESEGMGGMPFSSAGSRTRRGLAVAGALVLWAGNFSIVPAFAGDDGAAPIWTGLGGLVGLSGKDKDDPIDYRERPRLVLPPKMVLQPPAAPIVDKSAAWPVDPDVAKARKERAAMREILTSQSDLQAARDGNRLSPDQLRADRVGPGQDTAAAKRCAAQSNARGCDWVPFRNVLETIGLAKPDQVIAGQEPDRDWLTDPPKGYRRPTTDAVATTAEVKPKVNDADPRSALFHPPEN
jgi:hypothetical protein